MKKIIQVSMLILMLVGFAGCSGEYVVTDQPAEPYYVRPASPGVGYVWIDGDWYWSGGRYVYRNGYWSRPRPGRTWAPGRWERHGNGWHWNRGRWH